MYSQTLKTFFQRVESYTCKGYPATNSITPITSSFLTEILVSTESMVTLGF